MSRWVRARPAPVDLVEALEIAAPLVGDVRLRAEESEAVAMLVHELRKSKPSKRWTDPTAEDT